MKNTITTIVGDFKVNLSYQPSADDMILNRFTAVINRHATQPMVIVSEAHPDLDTVKDFEKLSTLAIKLMEANEAKIEKELYEATRAGGGAGRRLELSLKAREINPSNF